MSFLKKYWQWTPALLWMGVIFFLSSQTGFGGAKWMSIPAHIVEYGILSAFFWWALRRTTNLNPRPAILFTIFLSFSYGLTDELHQSFVPTRVADISDLGLDLIGATTAAVLADAGARKFKFLEGRKIS